VKVSTVLAGITVAAYPVEVEVPVKRPVPDMLVVPNPEEPARVPGIIV
jgi:hypothetical protein